jgi:integrase
MATDAKLSSPTSRARLKANTRHWRTISKGVALGYWRGTNRATWIMRELKDGGKYELSVVGRADDHERADSVTVFDFAGAQKKALALAGKTSGPLTVEQAVERYLEHIKVNSESAERDARSKLKKHVLPKLGEKRVTDLEIEDFRRWLRGLVKRDPEDEDRERRSKDTANRVLATFKAALNHSCPNPSAEWHKLKAFEDVDRARQDSFSEPDAGKLIEAARKDDPCFADLLEAAFHTGARAPGELARLDVRHFDPTKQKIKIVDGKTGPRITTLSAEGSEFFKRITDGKEPGDILLPHKNGGRWTKNLHQRPMQAALKAAELPASASLYSLRHTYISRAIEHGMMLLIIAENVGTSVRMIERNYAHVLDAARHRLIEAHAPSLRVVERQKIAA